MAARIRIVELRILEGPNLYFARPAVKLTLAVPAVLSANEDRARAIGRSVRLARTADPGEARSEARRRFAARLAAHVTRVLARRAGARLAVRSRPGPEPEDVVVAYPWRRRGTAEALGNEIETALRRVVAGRSSFRSIVDEAAGRLRSVEPGEAPAVAAPTIPVIMVTGTNGKTTTVRLLTHIVASSGRTVASTTTDGVYIGDRLVEEGDYSGPAGAARALEEEADVAVLEVARGGILLKGIGASHNDVAVVTNVSADHLGLHGITTLDQLAEVKATITTITKEEGWCVLNADDPRVLGMRERARGRPFLFSLDPDHPAIRDALTTGGRALAPLDGSLVVMSPGPELRTLVRLEDVPVTLAGISSQHIQNAMAATAAALGIGMDPEEVVAGLRTFVLDPERNPGRANLFELDGRVIVVDYAHNEAGMAGLVEICRGLRRPPAAVWMAIGTAGDRTDEVMHGMGYLAGRGADHVAVVELHRYLRGRDPQEVIDLLRAGAADGGAAEVPDFPTELDGMRWMLDRSGVRDVIGITALAQRPEMFRLLKERGAERIGPERCRELVREAGSPS